MMDGNTNLEEYLHPELYDLENPDFEPEGSFYLSIAKEAGGRVLELGCGTGRLTIPLARQGIDITGLDLVPDMLRRAKTKAGDLLIRWIQADARNFHLGEQFNLIFENGNVFMHMLTLVDQQAFLERVHEHLAERGCFVTCLFFPHPSAMQTINEEKEWFTYKDDQGRTVRVSGYEAYDELSQIKTETAIRKIEDAKGATVVLKAPLALRYTFPQEMEALLNHSRFEVKERYGGPDRSNLTGDSKFMVYVCKKRMPATKG